MKKKIALIVFGSLFVVAALVAALLYLKGPFVGFPGSPWDARNKMTPQEQALSPGTLKLVLVNSQTSNLIFESRSRHSEPSSGARGA